MSNPVRDLVDSTSKQVNQNNFDQKRPGAGKLESLPISSLLEAVGHDVTVASLVVRSRPGDVGELLQIAMNEGRPAAPLILAAARYEMQNGSVGADAIGRSVMRLVGRNSDEIKASLGSVMKDLGLGAQQAANGIEFSEKHPMQGRLIADLIDRPDAAVAELCEISNDPVKLAAATTTLEVVLEQQLGIHEPLLEAFARSTDARASRLKVSLLRQLDGIVLSDMREARAGHIQFNEPYIHAAKIVPMLTGLMLQPDVLPLLMNLHAEAAEGRKPELDLEKLLHHVLQRGWGEASRKIVMKQIAKTSAGMFRNALLATDDADRQGGSIRTAELIASSAKIEADEFGEDYARTMAEVVKTIASFIPGVASKAVNGARLIIDSFSDPYKPAWTRDVVNVIMRRVYVEIHPRAYQDADRDEATHYENEYTSWAALPLASYTSVLSGK